MVFVVTAIVVLLFENRPAAPEEGAVKVTEEPATGFPKLSFTVTARGLAKAVLIVVDCGVVPAFAVIEAAAPAVLVMLKLTAVTPTVLAVTL